MQRLRPTPLFGERALWLPAAKALVVGDVHIGLESEFRAKGLTVMSQTEKMRQRLLHLVDSTGAERLIVIGDLKHRIPVSSYQERQELPHFFAGLGVRVELVPGNHDVDFADHIRIDIHPAEGIRVGDVGLLHGHTWPAPEVMAAQTIVTCHNHPAVMLVDELGARHKEPAWVRAAFTEAAKSRYPDVRQDARLIVMPAFHELTGGTAFNAPEGGRLLGPLFSHGFVDVEGAEVFTLDGVGLGSVAALRKRGVDRSGRQKGSRWRRRPAAD